MTSVLPMPLGEWGAACAVEEQDTTTETTRGEIFGVIESLEDLKKQATVERSHYYVDAVATAAIKLLYKLAKERHAE
jgi:hypothetical protein